MISVTRGVFLICAASFLLLAACQPAATPVPTATATKIPTLTASPTATGTPTITPTSTETFTATPSFTNTPPYNAPGSYYVFSCVFITPSGSISEASRIRFCITSVVVLSDRSMRFNVLWTFTFYRLSEWDLRIRSLSKKSDRFNPNIALADNLKNNYSPINVTGCIATDYFLHAWDGDCGGSFFFDPAKPGATSFIYFDTGYDIAIGPIVLLKIPPTPTITLTGTQKTATPTKTAIPSATPTFTKTLTLSPTIDPNVVYNAPGTYWFYTCIPYPASGGLTGAKSVTLCLNTVVVGNDRTMKFNFTWKVETYYDLIKDPDSNKAMIYLEDDLANVYRFTQTGGCAAVRTEMTKPDDDCNGWFLFPPAEPGATSFRFMDYGNNVSFDNLVFMKQT